MICSNMLYPRQSNPFVNNLNKDRHGILTRFTDFMKPKIIIWWVAESGSQMIFSV